MNLIDFVKRQVNVDVQGLRASIQLLEEGATVPFIARYRKERTRGLDEVDLLAIKKAIKQYKDLLDRKEYISKVIEEQGKLHPGLEKKIKETWDLSTLEDIYLPYKKKRKTKADKARSLGLEGLAKIIMAQQEDFLDRAASRFVRGALASKEEALEGARHIIAEWVSENPRIRSMMREQFNRFAVITSKVKKLKEEQKEAAKLYKDYWDYTSRLDRTPGHRILAIRRGEREGILSVSIDVDVEKALDRIKGYFIKTRGECADQIEEAIKDAYKRLLKPSIEGEFARLSKEKADVEAIEIFAKNVSQLLLEAPLGEKVVIGIDPGFRTGCKVVALDQKGDLLHHTTIYPHPPQSNIGEAQEKIKQLYKKYSPKAIAIGNGTAGRETEAFIRGIDLPRVDVFLISESGASIYSASALAREEFPNLDLTVRGAISIGRRLMDPLAELIKIDPKSIGVGQYQHDVDQARLKQSLEDTVLSCVNRVGINVNTASKSLLTHVSGLGPGLASNIVDHRSSNGPFTSRKDLMAVKGLGKKAFEQAAGFLRIKKGQMALDDTGIHPERYSLVKRILKENRTELNQLLGNEERLKSIPWRQYVSEEVGMPTLNDIKKELAKPGHDPRGQAESFSFDPRLQKIQDVREGSIIPGIIINVAKFGAFVDLGIKENGLIHISQITDRFIDDPNEVLSVNQKVHVRVIGVDLDRKRIQLSLKDL
jgi:uncharacterized protein